MALVHKALSVQKKEQAKLATLEGEAGRLSDIMENMQLVQLALYRKLGTGAVKTFYSEVDGKYIDILLPHLYTARLVHPNGEERAIMSINGEVIKPVSRAVQHAIDDYYMELLMGYNEK